MRRSKEDTEKTKRAILAAAERQFIDNGFNRTTLEKIAAEAGCTRGAVHWHFVNKEGLLFALRDKERMPMRELVDTLKEDNSVDPLQGLLNATLNKFEHMEREPGRRALMGVMADLEAMAPKSKERMCHVAYCVILDVFLLAEKRGTLNPQWSAQHASLAYVNMIFGLVTEWVKGEVDYTLKDDASRIMTLFMTMVRRQGDVD